MSDVSPQCAAKQILATGADQVARPRSDAGWSRAVNVVIDGRKSADVGGGFNEDAHLVAVLGTLEADAVRGRAADVDGVDDGDVAGGHFSIGFSRCPAWPPMGVGRSWQRAFCGGSPCVPLSRASSRILVASS
jgi:hypothetical protein